MKTIEITGPPMAYFEFIEGDSIKRIVYRSIVVLDSSPHYAAIELNRRIMKLRAAMDSIGGIIYWRRKPIVDVELDEGEEIILNKFKASCRVETFPTLTEEVWEDIGCSDTNNGLRSK
jgi:hypothetical protein